MLRTIYYFKDSELSIKEYVQGKPAQSLSMEYNSMAYDFMIIGKVKVLLQRIQNIGINGLVHSK